MPTPAPPGFVAYYRVSTDKQSRFGLGLEAQRAAVAAHVAGVARGTVATELVEVESGGSAIGPSSPPRHAPTAPSS